MKLPATVFASSLSQGGVNGDLSIDWVMGCYVLLQRYGKGKTIFFIVQAKEKKELTIACL